MGRNCLNAVYNHVEKEMVAAILDFLGDVKFSHSCVYNTSLKVEQKSILVKLQPVLWIRIPELYVYPKCFLLPYSGSGLTSSVVEP